MGITELFSASIPILAICSVWLLRISWKNERKVHVWVIGFWLMKTQKIKLFMQLNRI